MCVNTDGDVASNSMRSAARGFLCDCEGNWMLGFMCFNGFCSPLQSELWEILTGLTIAWDQGYEKTILQFDCSVVVRLINDDNVSDSHCSLIWAIRRLQRREHVQNTSNGFHAKLIQLQTV
ncbi:hypothetical protein F3Y22_tig00111166pilonHSYRG00074 [Hibiscus syriacus]|uniref:RNase H type-1 domain-containing protein n=1 Tax=Hibiscus syriacus TaxID=106335 RepID=A0A6A2YWL3_HIBSY|nr:hypothetical protein F3Y22_tig00111166pilonHSYRG00074 [Hibiscus syriacus]